MAVYTRRKFLGIGSTMVGSLTAGCMEFVGRGTGMSAVIVRNGTTSPKTVEISIVRTSDGETKVDTSLTLASAETHTFDEGVVLLMNEEYTVTASILNGVTETYEWSDVKSPLQVIVTDSDNVLFAKTVG